MEETKDHQPAQSPPWRPGAKTVAVIVVTVLCTIFVYQNTEVVDVRLFFWTFSMSRVLLLLGMGTVGLLVGLFLGWEFFRKRK